MERKSLNVEQAKWPGIKQLNINLEKAKRPNNKQFKLLKAES